MKCIFLISAFLGVILSTGCSRDYLPARIHLYRAEQTFWKAHYILKNKKAPFEERKKHYFEACQLYIKAYQWNRGIFTAAKIEEASQSCFYGDYTEGRDAFDYALSLYCKDHSLECQHGDMPSPEWSEI